MKHVVNLILSQPDHDFVSMRSRRHEKTYMLEARNADEAILRATRKFKELGFYVHGASIVEQKAPEIQKAAPQVIAEGVAEVQAAQEKRKAAMKKATAEVDKSEVQDKAGKAQAGSALAQYLKNKASTMKEEVEVTSGYLEEKLGAGDPASKWIHDFVHSDNPKFEGKSKAERIKMALGAKYAADRAVKEEAEQIDEVSFSKPFTSRKPAMSSTAPSGEEREKVNPEIKKQLEKDPETMAAINKQVAASKAKNPFREEVELEEGVKNNPDFPRKHTSWFVKPPKGSRRFGKEFHMSKEKEAHDHAMEIGGSVHKMDQYGSTMKEEVEQVDELNKSTLKSYIKKASSDMFRKGTEAEARFRGKDISGSMKTGKKADVRQKGIDTAVEKLAKEEVEQIDELNKETLASYVGKAAQSVGTKERIAKGLAVNAATTTSKNKRDMYLKSAQTWRDAAARRVTGIKTAAEKLTKEDTQLEEVKADPVAKAKELLDQAEKGTYKGSAKALQAALEKAKKHNFDKTGKYELPEEIQLSEGLMKKLAVGAVLAAGALGSHAAHADAKSGTPGFSAGVKPAVIQKATLSGVSGGGGGSSSTSHSDGDGWKSQHPDAKVAAARTAKYHDVKSKGGSTQQAWDAAHQINEEQLDETGIVKKTNKTLKNVMAASKGAKINAAMGDAKMDPADYGYNKAQHLNKAIGRMVSRGAAFVEEEIEQLDEKSQEAKQKKAWKNTLTRIRGARIMKDSGITPQNIDLKTKQGKYYTQKDLNLQAGRAAQKGDLDEAAEGTAPSTPKEKELAAKAGDPNKITKKDVLAARGVKLDEVKGSYKDQATEKAEDKRLAKKEAKDTKSAKAAETLINLAKSKKNKINTSPSIEAHNTMGGK